MNMVQIDTVAGRRAERIFLAWGCVAFALVVSLFNTIDAVAAPMHPFHISLAEMEFNAETGRMEVALKLHTSDLQIAMSRLAKQPPKLDSPAAEKLLRDYLADHFYLIRHADAKKIQAGEKLAKDMPRSKVHFAGKESEKTWMWLYFELEMPRTDADLALVNTVFLDIVKGQINTVTVRKQQERLAMRLTVKQPWVALDSGWYKTEKE